MENWIKLFILCVVIVFMTLSPGQSCTTFCLDTGDVTNEFIDYSYQVNRNLIRSVFFKTYFTHIPKQILDLFSSYPERTLCND